MPGSCSAASAASPHEFRIVTKDGRIRWIMETVAFIPYKGSRAVLGNSMDITEQTEARNRLEALEALEASILEAIPHAVIGLQDRRIIFANDGVQSVFGWDALDLIGKSTRVIYRSDEDYEEMARILYTALEKQRTFKMEFLCRRKDGTDVECMITASRIGESLKEGNIVITYQDITDLKRAKTEVEQSRERLRNLSAHLESAREKERTRIARELHDELGQLLTALNTDLVLLMNSIPPSQTDLAKKAEDSIHLVEMTMETVKRIYMALRPGMLDHLGLAVAIDWLAKDFQKRTGIKCTVSIEPEELRLDADHVFFHLPHRPGNVHKHLAPCRGGPCDRQPEAESRPGRTRRPGQRQGDHAGTACKTELLWFTGNPGTGLPLGGRGRDLREEGPGHDGQGQHTTRGEREGP